jgi:hypothetical protein
MEEEKIMRRKLKKKRSKQTNFHLGGKIYWNEKIFTKRKNIKKKRNNK